MATWKICIGTKLAIMASLGVFLVIGMLVNQQIVDQSTQDHYRAAAVEEDVYKDIMAGQIAVERTQTGIRDLRLALTQQDVDGAFILLDKNAAEARAALDRAIANATANRDVLTTAHTKLDAYLTVAKDLGGKRRNFLNLATKREQSLKSWTKSMEAIRTYPKLDSLPKRAEFLATLREAEDTFKDGHVASWRFSATWETALIERVNRSLDKSLSFVLSSRDFVDEPLGKITDELMAALMDFSDIMRDTLLMGQQMERIRREQVEPLVREINGALGEAKQAAQQRAVERSATASAEVDLAGRIGLAAGIIIVIILAGSAVVSSLTIARPIRRIGSVLLELANGNKLVSIPYTSRGDEVGDNARAAEIFRDNLARMESLEAERRKMEETAASDRKAVMHQLADDFERAVGDIVRTVSAASTEIEAAAGTLTTTADATRELSTSVAAASEQASNNVQSAASAASQMAISVEEISRQVQQSSKIAAQAVTQAKQTDARMVELSEAASRVGDVVKLIAAIAEQTNLLALNATIEAARAGEAGKGFSVVAQEVKALAAQTAKATNEIGVQISGMQTATQDSVVAIKGIGNTIAQISDIAATIAAATDEQGAATQEIARTVQQASQGTASVAANIADVNRGASETGSASAQVLSAAQALANESNHLKVEVDKFLSTVRAA